MNKSRSKFNKPSLVEELKKAEKEAEKEQEEREEKEASRLRKMLSRTMFYGIIIAFILFGRVEFSNYRCDSPQGCGSTSAQFFLAISFILGFLIAFIELKIVAGRKNGKRKN